MTRVINIRQAPKDWESNPDYVYIGRTGHGQQGYFGNPYRLGSEEPRGTTLLRFRHWMYDRIERDPAYKSQ